MKKILIFMILLLLVFSFSGCNGEKQEIVITIPAGSMESFVFSEEVFEATKDKIIVTAGAVLRMTVSKSCRRSLLRLRKRLPAN